MLVTRDALNAASLFLKTGGDGVPVSDEGGDALGRALVSLVNVMPDEGKRLSDDWGRSIRDAAERLNRLLSPALHPFVSGKS